LGRKTAEKVAEVRHLKVSETLPLGQCPGIAGLSAETATTGISIFCQRPTGGSSSLAVEPALSRCQIWRVTNLLARWAHAAATTSRHVCMASSEGSVRSCRGY
jgi:hypothetical protein